MSKEKTFTVVGTSTDSKGNLKMRWANDLITRIKILIKADNEDIDLIELPQPMTKLESAEYLKQHRTLTPAQAEVVELKISEKTREAKRLDMKTTITKNVKARIKSKQTSDPKVAKFIETALENAE